MKPVHRYYSKPVLGVIICLGLVSLAQLPSSAAYQVEPEDAPARKQTLQEEKHIILKSGDGVVDVKTTGQEPKIRREEKRIILGTPGEKTGRERAWLGLATEEAPEALTSQLKLEPGVGLVVTYVAEESPAAKAELKKNDLLIRFGDQDLVHPAQLRKLVQARKPGDKVKLTFIRGGEEQTVQISLGKIEGAALPEGEKPVNGWFQLHDLRDWDLGENFRDHLALLRDHLGEIRIDKDRVQAEVKRSLQEAKKAVDEALRKAGDSKEAAEWSKKLSQELERAGLRHKGKTSVTVTHSDSNSTSVRTLVSSDEFGTIHLQSTPELSLTARDKDGKVLFKGPINTEEERDKVPRDLWERVEPLLKQLQKDKPESD